MVAQVADAMEVSAADPQHREMVAAYLADLELADDASVLEIGCGTGAIARELAAWPGVGGGRRSMMARGVRPDRQDALRPHDGLAQHQGRPRRPSEKATGLASTVPTAAFVADLIRAKCPRIAGVLARLGPFQRSRSQNQEALIEARNRRTPP